MSSMRTTLSKGIVRRHGDAIDTLQNVFDLSSADVKYPRQCLLKSKAAHVHGLGGAALANRPLGQ